MSRPVFIDPNKVTLTNWTYTVCFGSILWPIVFWGFGGGSPSGIALLAVVSWFVSAIAGIPALLLLAIVGKQLNKRDLRLKEYVTRHFAFHGLITLVTFGMLEYLFPGTREEGPPLRLIVIFSYVLTAAVAWLWSFERIRRTQHNFREELIDDDFHEQSD